MDTPAWVYRWIYGRPGINAIKKATLQFCGVTPVRVITFGTVFNSTPAQRAEWIERARAEGLRLAEGVPNRTERLRAKAASWLRAMRLQFYPMTWLAYAVGAMAAGGGKEALTTSLFWLGYAAIFLLEFATVLVNEYFDYESDRNNRNFSPFNGGSRVLVDGALSFHEVRQGITFTLGAFALCSALLLYAAGTAGVGLALGAALVLCLGYTAPPLRLSHRSLGEFDVAFTHSFLVLLFGYLLFGGHAADSFPWLASIPLFLAIIPAIALSTLPDRAADLAAGKRTLAVSLGTDRVIAVAMVATASSALAALVWHAGTLAAGAYAGISWVATAHALWLLHLLRRYRVSAKNTENAGNSGRINGLMAVALSYILWFALIPFLNML
jgi:1,4-dihydroxy-2-naphthoate octaprenyltransferase